MLFTIMMMMMFFHVSIQQTKPKNLKLGFLEDEHEYEYHKVFF
jgi:hypothetical protein